MEYVLEIGFILKYLKLSPDNVVNDRFFCTKYLNDLYGKIIFPLVQVTTMEMVLILFMKAVYVQLCKCNSETVNDLIQHYFYNRDTTTVRFYRHWLLCIE